MLCGEVFLITSAVAVIGFERPQYDVMEGENHTIAVVLKSGNLRKNVGVRVFTQPGTAQGLFRVVFHSY